MEQLKVDWLTDGLIDFEYKKYVLLAYLKNVRANFDDKKLYPFMSDMVFHYQNLMTIKSNKSLLYENLFVFKSGCEQRREHIPVSAHFL